ncbi:hypothetical protein [Ralstonia pseudosolanacearum]|uniref:hypothetical protein n=1 Tax=Ralstonia pseudosolanacearum TaxID=1310165 RepID=UPI003CE72844
MNLHEVLPANWTEATPGGMATNPDPMLGGIVDREIVSGKWFVVFNRDDLDLLDGFATRQSAFEAFARTIPQQASPVC